MTTMNATPTRRVRADDAGTIRVPREWLKPIAIALGAFATGGGLTLSVAGGGGNQLSAAAPAPELHTLLSEFREFRAETRAGIVQIQANLADARERLSGLEGALTGEPSRR
jgi:hypothetical protein